MRVSVCVGDYATIPYSIPGLEMQVYCMEELCFCLRENAFLLDLSLLDDKLVNWINTECGLKDLAEALSAMVLKQGSLSAFVSLILRYVGLYDADVIYGLETQLKESSGLSGIEKKKNQIDYLVQKHKYWAAVQRYDELLQGWQEEAGSRVKAAVLHNKGVALTGLMEYGSAAECFREAYELSESEESHIALLAAKRMELSEGEYLTFIAECSGSYEQSLALEKAIEPLEAGFRTQEAYRKIGELKDWKSGGEKQKYYEELEKIGRVLKESYRKSVNE